jgi:hypothetical protein
MKTLVRMFRGKDESGIDAIQQELNNFVSYINATGGEVIHTNTSLSHELTLGGFTRPHLIVTVWWIDRSDDESHTPSN